MRPFLDSSIVLAAIGSETGASRETFRRATSAGWILRCTPYVIDEVDANLGDLRFDAAARWSELREHLVVMDDVLTLDRVAVFEPAKDRPILYSALAWSEVLLTLDRADFGALLGGEVYGVPILTPGAFLVRERAAGRLTS